MRVDRPIGTWLVLWPSLWALVAASKPYYPDWQLLLIFSLGSFLMRSAGCVANDLADQKIDPLVTRTKARPLAAKRISEGSAKWLLLGLLLAAFLLALQLNIFAIKLSVVGALLAVTYPFSKRFIHIPQFYLGAAFGWGVIIAWGAATEMVTVAAWLFFAATLTWAAAYDTIYAMMDRDDDLRIGVKSTAILFGRWAMHAVALLYLLTVGFLFLAGWYLCLSKPFYLVMLLALVQMGWQIRISRRYQAGDQQLGGEYLRAFLSNQWLGLLILLGVVLG